MNWKRALVAQTLTLGLVATSAAWASTQDVAPAPAPAPPAKAAAPVQKKKPVAKKPAAKSTNAAVKTTCEPTRTFVPVQPQSVCTPAAAPVEGEKFNTLEDIYIPPPEPAKKK